MPRTKASELRRAAKAELEAQEARVQDAGSASEEQHSSHDGSEESAVEYESDVDMQTDSVKLPEVAGEGANPQGEAPPTVTVAWLRAKEEFNKTPNAQAAQKTISDMVNKASAEAKVDDKSIPGKAKQYLEICAAQETVAFEWFESNGDRGRSGADDHIANFRKSRSDAYKMNDTMRAIKLHLVNVLIELRMENPGDSRYKEAGQRTPFPTSQNPADLLQGMRQLRFQATVASLGDPLKERTLQLARELVLPENNLMTPTECRNKLEQYFLDIGAMEEKEEFAAEFCLVMHGNEKSNSSRVWLTVLRERGVLNPNGSIMENCTMSVLELIEVFKLKVCGDIHNQKVIQDRWRVAAGTHKRGAELPAGDPSASKKKKGSDAATGAAGAGSNKVKPECWVCGRKHDGKCGWFNHPERGSKNVVWAQSAAGKRQIEHKVAQLQGTVSVLNVYKHWTGSKFENYTREEVDSLKLKSNEPKPGHQAKGKIAELLLNVTEVESENVDTSNPPPTSAIKPPPSNPTDDIVDPSVNRGPVSKFRFPELRNVTFTQGQMFGFKDDKIKTACRFIPDTGSLSSRLSGNYISRETCNALVKISKCKVYKHENSINVDFPAELGMEGSTAVNDHVYFYLEYRSRTEPRVMRAVLKAYVIEDLIVPIIVGKNDLLGNSWIESKHLWGCDPKLAKLESQEMLKQWMLDTYGKYDMDIDSAPIETMAKKSKSSFEDKRVRDMLFALSEKMETASEAENLYHLVDPEQRSEDENDRYYEDVDKDADYEEGELPSQIEGSSEEALEEIRKMLHDVKSVFSKELSKNPAKVKPYEMDIDKEKWEKTRQTNGYRKQSYLKEQAMKEYIDLYQGILFQISEASQASQVNMVPKSEPGSYRFTCDFRVLNECCRKMDFQLPKIWDIITRIGKSGANFFSKIDLTQGFHQVPLHEDSKKYTSFRTSQGNWEYLRMAMGLKGSPQYFQKIMIDILRNCKDEKGRSICEVYIDDILVFGHTEKELLMNTKMVLKKLQEYSITVNPKKTSIGMQTLDYLGLTLTQDRKIMVSEKRQQELGQFEQPTKWKGMKSFLGIVNVFHKQIKDCANLQHKLNSMIPAYTRAKANHILKWNEETEVAFQTLKERVQSIPQMSLMSRGANYKTILQTDASDYGCGAHLLQKEILGTDALGNETYGEERAIQFVSKAFDKTQLNWSTPEKECYGVWYACKKLQYLLEGEVFEIEVDHKNLTILKDSVNQKVQRWKNFLQRFDAKWRYIPGPENIVADGLSRMRESGDEETEEEIKIRDILLSLLEGIDVDSGREEAQEMYSTRTMADQKPANFSTDKHREHDMEEMLLLLPEEEKEILEQKVFLKTIVKKFHNKIEGHLGINKTMHCVETYLHDHPEEMVKKIKYKVKYEAIKEYIDECPVCQKTTKEFEKLYTEPFVGSTYEPMECVQIDHIGPLGSTPDAQGNLHILVIVDTFTRWTELYPVPDVGADTTAICLGDYILRYGPPRIVHSDRGSAFIDASFNALAKMANIEVTHPMAGDKESTGIVERENQEVRRHLNNLMLENFMKDTWSWALKLVQRILNNTVHTTTGYAPAKLLYGKLISGPSTIYEKPVGVDEKEYMRYMKSRLDLQSKIMKYMKDRMMHRDKINLANRAHPRRTILEPGEHVLLKRKVKNKQQVEWTGPYMVTDKSRDFYELTSLLEDRTPFFAHARNLKRFLVAEGVVPKEIAMMDENEYELDKIKEISQIEGTHSPSSRESYLYAITYVGYPEDIHWVKYDYVKREKSFVEWCLANKKFGWMDAEAKKIHATLIDADTKKRTAAAVDLAEEKADKKARNKEKIAVKRKNPEEKALEAIRKRTRK